MSITKNVFVDLIEIDDKNVVFVREKISIIEDGKQIGTSFHRHVVAPGDDYSNEDARVKAICAATHTADVIAAYKAAQAAQGV